MPSTHTMKSSGPMRAGRPGIMEARTFVPQERATNVPAMTEMARAVWWREPVIFKGKLDSLRSSPETRNYDGTERSAAQFIGEGSLERGKTGVNSEGTLKVGVNGKGGSRRVSEASSSAYEKTTITGDKRAVHLSRQAFSTVRSIALLVCTPYTPYRSSQLSNSGIFHHSWVIQYFQV